MKIRSSPRSLANTKRPDASAWIMCAWGLSCPLKAKLPSRRAVGLLRAQASLIVNHVRGGAQFAIRVDGKHRHAPSRIVGHQHILARGVNAHMGGAGAFRADGVQQGQVPAGAIDGVGADRAGIAAGKIGDFIRRIQILARG